MVFYCEVAAGSIELQSVAAPTQVSELSVHKGSVYFCM